MQCIFSIDAGTVCGGFLLFHLRGELEETNVKPFLTGSSNTPRGSGSILGTESSSVKPGRCSTVVLVMMLLYPRVRKKP